MLTNNEIKLIKSLSIKKYRDQSKLFIAEGHKIVDEMLALEAPIKHLVTDEETIKKISNFNSKPQIIAIGEITEKVLEVENIKKGITLILDDIQDPGNLGTIIRICDWFGINNIVCSETSVDMYNPKVIQATMGAFLRVNVFYENLEKFIKKYQAETGNKCYGTFLTGENIYAMEKERDCAIIFGNEGNGISKEIENLVDKKINIPCFSKNSIHAESLNISVATAVVCSEFVKN